MPDLLDRAVTGLCLLAGIGSVGILLWFSVREVRARWRFRGIGR